MTTPAAATLSPHLVALTVNAQANPRHLLLLLALELSGKNVPFDRLMVTAGQGTPHRVELELRRVLSEDLLARLRELPGVSGVWAGPVPEEEPVEFMD